MAAAWKNICRFKNNSDETGEDGQESAGNTDVTDLSSHDLKLSLEKSLVVRILIITGLRDDTRLSSITHCEDNSLTKTILNGR